MRPPAARQPEGPHARPQRRQHRRRQAEPEGDDQAVGLQPGEGQRQRRQRQHPGFDQRPRAHRRGDIVAEGQCGEADVRSDDGDDDQREPAVEAADLSVGKDDDRQRHQQHRTGHRQQQPQHQPVGDDMVVGALLRGQFGGQTALQAERRQRRHQFDDHRRIGEPAERGDAVRHLAIDLEPPGDEQERQPRHQPQQETEKAGAAAAGQCRRFASLRLAGLRRPVFRCRHERAGSARAGTAAPRGRAHGQGGGRARR